MKEKFDNEELIALVEQNPCIWNPFLKNYRNRDVRRIAWQRIAAVLRADPEFIAKRWRHLRDRYKKEVVNGKPVRKDGSWDYCDQMAFLDDTYDEKTLVSCVYKKARSSLKEEPIYETIDEPYTSEPHIVTVPRRKGLRPIAPKVDESDKPSAPITLKVLTNSNAESESNVQVSKEPEIYLVTPTHFNDQEGTLFNSSLGTSTKRKAVAEDDDDEEEDDEKEDDYISSAKYAAIERETLLRKKESNRRLQWEEREHLLRMQCHEEEHKVKMEVEEARLRVEEENLKIKEQKLKVLILKEEYYKGLINAKKINEEDDE